MENKLAKGILFSNTIDFLKKEKGDEALSTLEKDTGPLLFDPHRLYPLDQLLMLQIKVIQAIYGNESNDNYKKLGEFAFQSFTHTLVGATLTNIAHSPTELLTKIQELWDTVVNFGYRQVLEMNENEHFALLEIRDDPREPAYLQGIIEAGLKSIGTIATTEVRHTDNETYQIEVKW